MSTDLFRITVKALDRSKRQTTLRVLVLEPTVRLPADASFFMRVLLDTTGGRSGPLHREVSPEAAFNDAWVNRHTTRYLERVRCTAATGGQAAVAEYEVTTRQAASLAHLTRGATWDTTAYETRAKMPVGHFEPGPHLLEARRERQPELLAQVEVAPRVQSRQGGLRGEVLERGVAIQSRGAGPACLVRWDLGDEGLVLQADLLSVTTHDPYERAHAAPEAFWTKLLELAPRAQAEALSDFSLKGAGLTAHPARAAKDAPVAFRKQLKEEGGVPMHHHTARLLGLLRPLPPARALEVVIELLAGFLGDTPNVKKKHGTRKGKGLTAGEKVGPHDLVYGNPCTLLASVLAVLLHDGWKRGKGSAPLTPAQVRRLRSLSKQAETLPSLSRVLLYSLQATTCFPGAITLRFGPTDVRSITGFKTFKRER